MQADQGQKPDTNGEALEEFFAELVNTRQFKSLTGALVPHLLRMWAGKSDWRKRLLRPLERSFIKALEADEAEEQAAGRWKQADMAGLIIERLPVLVNTGAVTASELSSALKDLPEPEREALLANILEDADWGFPARLATVVLSVMNGIREKNPTFFADRLAPAVEAIVAGLDFGELEEAVQRARPEAEALVDVFNEALFKYPAKVVCMAGLLPAVMNLLSSCLTRLLAPVNEMSPELATEILLSLLREVDGKAMARLVNETAEAARKIHTGSSLLGPPGLPEFTATLSRKLVEIGRDIDPKLLWKARQAKAEVEEAWLFARSELFRDRPEMLKARLAETPKIRNAKLRAKRTDVSLLEELADADLAEAVAEGVVAIDAQEVAETLNLWCAVLNRAREERPDFFRNMLLHFANSADTDEMRQTLKWMGEDLAEAARPVARALLPEVLKTVADWLSPEDDEHEPAVADSLAAWRELLSREESE
ncbi:MAG: hypothetical protein JRI97_05265 [Deltaproteobacteria bacterium]|nr:hypothetical protein [Deltaproteobacteria bacterium]